MGEHRRELGDTRQIGFMMSARRNRWDAAQGAFARSRDRARVERVLAEVEAAVDAGTDDVRPSREEARPCVERRVDAVRGVPSIAKRFSSTTRARSGRCRLSE